MGEGIDLEYVYGWLLVVSLDILTSEVTDLGHSASRSNALAAAKLPGNDRPHLRRRVGMASRSSTMRTATVPGVSADSSACACGWAKSVTVSVAM